MWRLADGGYPVATRVIGRMARAMLPADPVGRVEPFGPPRESMHPTIFIGICSCRRHAARRQAVRNTWLRSLPADMNALFFVGAGIDSASEEPGLVELPVSDAYEQLTVKVLSFYRYVLERFSFDYLFKCDDDTYVHVERLRKLARPGVHLLGSQELDHHGFASGGAGYLLSRSMLETVVRTPVQPHQAEDLIFTRRCFQSGLRIESTPLLRAFGDEVPERDNEIVTGHWCGPFEMLRIHGALTGDWPGARLVRLRAEHEAWKGFIRLYADGSFWS